MLGTRDTEHENNRTRITLFCVPLEARWGTVLHEPESGRVRKYGQVYHVRLSGEPQARFDRVYASFRGLPGSVVLRMLVADLLTTKSDEELRGVIEAAIRGERASVKTTSRIGGNTRRANT